jgi:hypothetical protein
VVGVTRAIAAALVVALWLAAGGASAQELHWNDPGPLGLGQQSALELVFENTSPEGSVELPPIAGLDVLGAPSTSTQFTMENFRASSRTTLSFPVRATQRGSIEIPAFEVETGDGALAVPPIRLEVGEPRASRGGPALGDVVRARLRVENRRPYAGEVFPVVLELETRGGAQIRRIATPQWQSPGVTAEAFGERSVQPRQGLGRKLSFSALAMAAQPGPLALAPAQIELELLTGRRSSFFFSEVLPVEIESEAPALEVRALPEPAPAGFAGAVGSFALDSVLVPEEVRVGEPITWTLRLSGEGNWPAGIGLPPRELPRELRVVQPKSERHFAEGDLFQGSLSEDLVLIPTLAGELALPPLRFAWFDPSEERYREVTVTPPVIRVLPPAASSPPAPGIAAQPETPARSEPEAGVAGAEAAPSGVERAARGAGDTELRRLPGAEDAPLLPAPEPIAGRGARLAPLAAAPARALALAPIAALAAYWIALALRRAARLDPVREQREAVAELDRRIADVELRRRDRADCARALLAWQDCARRALAASAVAPGFPRAAAEAALGAHSVQARDAWSSLWAESDALIYGEAELAADWCVRARSARSHLRAPRFRAHTALALRNWWPRPATLALLLAGGFAAAAFAPGARAQSDPAAPAGAGTPESTRDAGVAADPLLTAYREGDFERARAGYAKRVELDPADWIARANLGLAQAQLGRTGEALASTLAAFLRAPREPGLRWNLRLAAAAAGAADPGVAALADGRGVAALARLASPAEWQLALALGCAVACGATALALRARFASGASASRLARAGLATGTGLGAVSALALVSYGALADPAAALLVEPAALRSIPTEAAREALSRPLEAGALLRVRGSFLGWRRVERGNDEQGWLRAEAISPLYAEPQLPEAPAQPLPSA